ncbi:hypothetical protein HPB51_007419 [Rhipicephalus microplus]|uniref:Uncharacterized protein n=1 Tax=Rhipicephalus microplus TaxID=6941 RepID=A0A9J6EZ86_RHIMP|nr:hypothetical protein HPB51_007419 [Rhipicephalus microplus]
MEGLLFLKVKYGRLRAHLVERECRRDQQQQQQPGPKGGGPLAPIPEDEADSPDGEVPSCVRDSPLLMGLHLEAQRLQQELRRAQRAYWDLVLGSDCGDDSAEVVVDLLSQLEKRDTELSRARGRCERLSEALAQSEREVAACRDALHDYQLQMEAQRATHEAQRSRVHDLQLQHSPGKRSCAWQCPVLSLSEDDDDNDCVFAATLCAVATVWPACGEKGRASSRREKQIGS